MNAQDIKRKKKTVFVDVGGRINVDGHFCRDRHHHCSLHKHTRKPQ